MSKQVNREGQTTIHKLRNKIDMKTTETDCTYEFTRLTQRLCFTIYVVTTMKSPTSSRLCTIWLFAHDLLSRHKREDFITTTQTAVSTIIGQVFTQTGLTALPSHQKHLQLLRPQATPVPPASAGFTLLQITPVPSRFHAVVWFLDILHGVRARFI